MTALKPNAPGNQKPPAFEGVFEYYVLDDQLRNIQMIEGHTSFIWTERTSSWGDIKIDIQSTDRNRSLLAIDTLIACSESTYIMRVETITDSVNDDDEAVIEVTGRSIEALLDDRIAITPEQLADLADTPNWTITDTPGNVARTIFKTICVDLVNNPGDAIPFYTEGTFIAPGSVGEPTEIVTVTIAPMSVYSAIKQVCDTYALGFRLARNPSNNRLYFDIFTGDDLTSAQHILPAVIFSPSMENLSNTKKLTSKANYKNVAYVVGKNQVNIVFGVGEDTEAQGFDRRVLVVQATDVDEDSVPDVDAALDQKGLEALAAAQKVYQFDGEISEFGVYRYGRDYTLGDLVEERDRTGFGNQMRVIEQIFVSDNQGDRSYPTLSLTLVIVPGTWSAWTPSGQVWVDVPEKEVWANQ